ncbi:hypothetical protein, partial [Klebsiella pneumoniae]|uniref:hypothetical protein n=1 Tax=Klebsiella pneumoniae TaxID=573 RepID=UPI0025A17F56
LEPIVDDYDPKKSGKVNYQPFITQIQDGIIFKSFADKLYVKIKKDFQIKNINSIHLFEDADTARTEFLSFDTMLDTMRRAGVDIIRED